MTEIRRVRMKFGNVEFEADVPEDRVEPMYDQFLRALERRKGAADKTIRAITAGVKLSVSRAEAAEPSIAAPDSFGSGILRRLFDLREDGVVALKVLPKGAEQGAEALLLILYGYRRLKNEDGVLATQLHRAAAQSGVSIRWPAYELATYDRFVNRVGRRKGSAYSLNGQGLAMAQEITTKMLGAILLTGPHEILE